MTDDIETRLRRLEDLEGINLTMAVYGHTIDAGEEDAWVDVFTEDGEFKASGPGDYPPFAIGGRDQLRDFISHHSRRPEAYHEHLTLMPVIELAGDTATSRARFVVLVVDGIRPVVRVFGTYYDQLQRGADGTWRFRVRRAEIEAFGSDLPGLAYAR
jgi:hypothetical protein